MIWRSMNRLSAMTATSRSALCPTRRCARSAAVRDTRESWRDSRSWFAPPMNFGRRWPPQPPAPRCQRSTSTTPPRSTCPTAKTPVPANCADPRSRPQRCSDYSVAVPANTTLASGRGRASTGARLFSRTFTWCPMLEVKVALAPGSATIEAKSSTTTATTSRREECRARQVSEGGRSQWRTLVHGRPGHRRGVVRRFRRRRIHRCRTQRRRAMAGVVGRQNAVAGAQLERRRPEAAGDRRRQRRPQSRCAHPARTRDVRG